MVAIAKKIVGYAVNFSPGSPKNPTTITISCEDNYGLSLIFLREPRPELINEYVPAGRVGFAYIDGTGQFPHYIDLLRNEGPLNVEFRPDDTPPEFFIYTAVTEGIGEGEIAGTLEEIRNRL